MIKNDFTVFIQAYNIANAELRKVIDGPEIPDFVENIIGKNPDLKDFYRELVDLIADIVLNIVSLRTALESLRADPKIGQLYSANLASDIEDFIHQIRKRVGIFDTDELTEQKVEGPVAEKPFVFTPSETVAATDITTTNAPVASEIGGGIEADSAQTQSTQSAESTRPSLMDSSGLKPLRTFGEDVAISRAHSYGAFQSGEEHEDADSTPVHRSNQDDILKK